MTSSLARRTGALVLTGALAGGALALLPAGSAQAAQNDNEAIAPATTWLTSQLTRGRIHNDQYDFYDYGLSIDTGLGLAAVSPKDPTVDTISDTVARHLPAYVGKGTERYAGATAKAAVLAQTAGDGARSFGGVDLINRVERLTTDSGATKGRISDRSDYGDFANVIGQSFATQALDKAGSSERGAARSFLLQQQCAPGWFRVDFSATDAPDQSCDGSTGSAADTDATALAVLALLDQRDHAPVAAAVRRAAAWLTDTQKSNGSFGGGTATEASNANSTGLAGRVLAVTGHAGAARMAAVWVRQRQLAGIGTCQPFVKADLGALAYDDAARKTARQDGITVETQDQFRRATAQALPVLQYAPAASRNRSISGGFTGAFVRAGATRRFTVTGIAPGSPVCGSVGESRQLVVAGSAGRAVVPVTAPKSTGRVGARVVSRSNSMASSVYVLARKTIGFDFAKAKVPAGGKQTVRAHGLAPKEKVRLRYRGKQVDSGFANADGVFVGGFSVYSKPGTYDVTVTGQFQDIRRGIKSFTVTR